MELIRIASALTWHIVQWFIGFTAETIINRTVSVVVQSGNTKVSNGDFSSYGMHGDNIWCLSGLFIICTHRNMIRKNVRWRAPKSSLEVILTGKITNSAHPKPYFRDCVLRKLFIVFYMCPDLRCRRYPGSISDEMFIFDRFTGPPNPVW